MTTLLESPTQVATPSEDDKARAVAAEPALPTTGGQGEAPIEDDDKGVSTVTLRLVVISATLSALGAAWMVGGMFRGVEARLVAGLGVLIGAALSYYGTRWRAPFLHYLTLPAALLVGAGLMASASGAGTSSLPALVKDAASSSQILQPPVEFAPGWRLILVVVLSLLCAAACALALSLRRNRLAVAVPVPLTIAAALVQPPGSAVATSAVSVGCVVMALATSYTADGVGDTFDLGFEVRRLGRSAVAGLVLIGALVAVSKVGFLFPNEQPHHVIPPRKPPVSPPQPNVPLYRVKGTLTGPLRLGVIDVYDQRQQAWLLPPVDNQRLKRLNLPANVPSPPAATGPTSQITVTVEQATGHLLPDLAETTHISGSATIDYDPRTNTLSLANRPVYTGLSYTLSVASMPTGAQLSALPGSVPPSMRPFLQAPPVPQAVEALLAKAPQGAYARLQYLRAALYKHFTAAGEGKPTDVSAARVVQLLKGGTGNPYELTASEALLARWAGIPSRIGYGYYHGTTLPDGETEFRPANAATYLEVWFAPYGWVPIVGTPPHAQASLDNIQHQTNSHILPSPDLGLQVFLPVRLPPNIPLYEYVRYFAARVLPVLGGVGLLWLVYPIVLKRVRRRRRARWAAAHGPAGVIAAAYCDLRDLLIDLALPGQRATPLELLEMVAEDEEHAELAWLVTRGLWGDLRERLTDEDAETARRLAASVQTRIAKAQPETARLLAAISRASLRAPYSTEPPNVWWQLRLPRPRLSLVAVRRLRPGMATAVVALVATVLLGGCEGPSGIATPRKAVPLPSRLAPSVVGSLITREQPKAAAVFTTGAKQADVIVAGGDVLSFSKDGLIQAALQVAQLKPGYSTSNPTVVAAITRSMAASGRVSRLRDEDAHALYTSTQGSQRVYLWFPTSGSMAFLVVRSEITQGAAEALARALIDYEDGRSINQRALAAAFATIPGVTQRVITTAPSAPATPNPTASSSRR